MQANEYLGEKAYLKSLERERAKKIEDRYKEKREALRQELLTGQEWGGVQPQPRYRPSFYEQWGGMQGSDPYMSWFENYFPALVNRFQATLPTYKGFKTTEGAVAETGKIESQWDKWLRGKQGELREEWWNKTPYQRGEKPWAYQPMIRTRSF